MVQYCCNCQGTVGMYALENCTGNSAQASTFSWTISWIQQGDASQCFLNWANRIRENYKSSVVETTMKQSLFKQKLSKVSCSSRDDTTSAYCISTKPVGGDVWKEICRLHEDSQHLFRKIPRCCKATCTLKSLWQPHTNVGVNIPYYCSMYPRQSWLLTMC